MQYVISGISFMKQAALIVMKSQFILNKIKATFGQTELTQEHICYVLFFP